MLCQHYQLTIHIKTQHQQHNMQSLANRENSDYYFANGSAGLGVAVGELWTPAALTTSLWLDAADASTVTLNSGNVSAWNDKSGNARHATQATAASQPLYATNALNGLNVVRPDADEEFLGLNAALASGSIFIVYSTESGQTETINKWLFGDRPGLTRLYHFHGGFPGSLLFNSDVSLAVNGSPAAARVNGTAIAPLSVTKTTSHTILALTQLKTGGPWYFSSLGTDNLTPSDTSWRGDYAEVIVLPSAATTEQTELLEGYLAWKWDLVSTLPNDHPYKNRIPRL